MTTPEATREDSRETVSAHGRRHARADSGGERHGAAARHPPLFAPGAGWSYSNTNYAIAGLLIERVTGHAWGAEVRRRVLVPLGLRATYVPGDRVRIPVPHPRGYVRTGEGAALEDVTEFNPSVTGAAGQLISRAGDVSRFFAALLGGRLLRPAELRAMTTTRPTGNADGRAYVLGLESHPLPCGGLYRGHGGDIFGFATLSGTTTDGRQATVMANLDPGGPEAQDDDLTTAVSTALCSR